MGDQALAAGSLQVAKDRGIDTRLFAPGNARPWRDLDLPVSSFNDWHRGRRQRLTPTAFEYAQNDAVFVIGADIIDGRYDHASLAVRVRLLNAAVRAGGIGRLVNFSLSAAPTRLSIAMLRQLDDRVALWARDPESQQRAMTWLSRQVDLAPDVGAFMQVPRSVARDLDDAGLFAAPDLPLATLVPNAHVATDFGADIESLRQFWIALATDLCRTHHVVVMPHDVRQFPDDPGFSASVVQGATAAPGSRLRLFVPSSAAEAKGLAARSALCVAARMHAAVGSLSSGTPTVGLDYLQKFEGQFSWYDGLGTTIPFEQILNVETVASAARAIASQNRHRQPGRALESSTVGWI